MRIVFMIIFFISCNYFIYSHDIQTDQLPIVRYVTSKAGLNVRSRPSRTGERLGTLLYGSRVILVIRSDNMETIDEITDYWYALPAVPSWRNANGWIFGGCLSTIMPDDIPVILGRWYIEGQNKSYYWYIDPDGFAVHEGLHYDGSSFGGY